MSDIKIVSDIKISRIDNRSFLQIGAEQVEVVDYNLKSSADGSTELSVVIRGNSSIFESSTNLKV